MKPKQLKLLRARYRVLGEFLDDLEALDLSNQPASVEGALSAMTEYAEEFAGLLAEYLAQETAPPEKSK